MDIKRAGKRHVSELSHYYGKISYDEHLKAWSRKEWCVEWKDSYYNKAEQKIIFLWNDFENCEPIVKTLAGKPPDDSLYMEIANGLKEMVTLMCRLDQLLEILKEKTEINEIIKVLDLIKALMIMSFPFVASIQNNRNDG